MAAVADELALQCRQDVLRMIQKIGRIDLGTPVADKHVAPRRLIFISDA